ncbi:MAG: OmpA family protein, partial [Bacteroidales bacterium]|nr:OmpA family protein [Bacteroidales bacterium]
DLWYSVFNQKKGKYSSAKNLGSKINTKADEITPFYDKSTSRLYFSSNYYPGYGGFDVFKSSGELRKWSQPVNLGKTVNTPADELYYTLNPQRKKEGFFASNRKGGYTAMHETCCDDLYYFQTEDIGNLFVKGSVEIAEIEIDTITQYDIISYIVEESKHEEIIVDSSMLNRIKNMKVAYADNSADALRGAIISVYQLENDGSGNNHEIFLFSDTTDSKGRYLLELEPFYNYKINYKRDEFFNQNINISTVSPGWNDTIYMDPIGLKPIPKDPMQFNVFYALNSDKMKPESQERIDSTLLVILQESPDLIVEISSYTDNTGSTKYNKTLSQKRAESVVEYLEGKGIDAGRLIAVGYGEENPIASNNSEAGRAKNRRTEIRVVGSLDQFSKTNVGDFKVIKGTSSR